MNITSTKAGLTGISGAATTHSTGSSAILYSIRGRAYSKSQISGGTTPTTDAITGEDLALPPGKGTVIAWCLDASGDVNLALGSVEDLSDDNDFMVAPQFPILANHEFTAFAYTVHKAASSRSDNFRVGTDNWNSTGMTHTVVDVMALPRTPQID